MREYMYKFKNYINFILKPSIYSSFSNRTDIIWIKICMEINNMIRIMQNYADVKFSIKFEYQMLRACANNLSHRVAADGAPKTAKNVGRSRRSCDACVRDLFCVRRVLFIRLHVILYRRPLNALIESLK